MKTIEFLKNQIIESRNFVNRLVYETPQDLWYVIVPNTHSNFAWQIGHLIISQNFHAITCITGRNDKVFNLIPVAKYIKLFNGMGTQHRWVERDLVPPAKLIEQLNVVHEICIDNLMTLDDDVLLCDLEPISFKHPVAVTKYEALSWCFKHEMWHCAEMEAIKQALGYPIVWMK